MIFQKPSSERDDPTRYELDFMVNASATNDPAAWSLRRRSGRVSKIVSIAILMLIFSVGCGPVWYLDGDLGERTAAENNRPMLVYFKSWDSSLHRNMKLQVFSNSAVKSEMTDLVNVELEFAYFPEHRKRYGVQRSQVAVMCDPQGRRVGSPIDLNPVPTPEVFLDWLRKAKAEARPPPRP